MQISVVVPLYNEEESLPELEAWIRRVMEANSFSYEIVMVDDGSKDTSWKIVEDLASKNPNVRGIKFLRNYGKAAALNEGFSIVKGDVVITMDADLQDSPDEIPKLYNMVMEGGFDMVSGWKQKRHDPLSKTLPSKLYNGLTRWMSGIPLNDFNCGLKAYRNRVVKSIEVFGDMHRYIPLLVKWAGFNKIGEKVVEHQSRKYGVSKYGFGRAKGVLDLFSISFIAKYSKSPMHFFGLWGTFSLFTGAGVLLYLVIDRLCFAGYGMTERPLFFFGIIFLLVGMQLFLSGFLAELIIRNQPSRNQYLIEKSL